MEKHTYKAYNFGDLVFVDLGVNTGCEQNKKRPCIIILDEGENSDSVVIVPVASKQKTLVTHIGLNFDDLYKPSYIDPKDFKKYKGTILCEHMRSVHKDMIISNVLCALRDNTKTFLSKCLKKILGLENYYNFEFKKEEDIEENLIISLKSIEKEDFVLETNNQYKRGEIVTVNFGNDALIKGLVKCIVLSPNFANTNTNNSNLIVVPLIETNDGNNHLFKIKSEKEYNLNMNQELYINLSILRAIDKERVVETHGTLSSKTLDYIDIFIENKYPVKVLFEYKVLKGHIKNVNNIIVL